MPPAPIRTPHPSSDDIALAQRGDMDAFERLYRAHAGRVNALCVRLTGGSGAEDLLQDVFVRMWEKLPSYRGEAAFSTWLHRLAVNVFFGARRSDLRREARVMATDDPEQGDLDPVRGYADEDLDARMDLERAIARLPVGPRTAFVLHDIEGYQHQEIADMQGVAAITIRVQLHRARKLLMRELDR
jgi:RNA polymerase sigma-70 factor (ECF subfamily)